MQHVGQRLNVHQAVFDGDVEQSLNRKLAGHSLGLLGCALQQFFIECSADIPHVVANGVERGPIRGLIRWKAATDRVDAEGEEPIEFRVETLKSESSFVEQVPIKGFEVPDVEDDAMTLRNGAIVDRGCLHDVE